MFSLRMMETLFIQLGDLMVNIAKVNYFKPAVVPHKSYMFLAGEPAPVELDIGIEAVQRALAETYKQMAMMQAAANRAYGPQGQA